MRKILLIIFISAISVCIWGQKRSVELVSPYRFTYKVMTGPTASNNSMVVNTQNKEQPITTTTKAKKVTNKENAPDTTNIVVMDIEEKDLKTIEQATKLYTRYLEYHGSAKHVNVFHNIIKRTKQNPTDKNIEDLKLSMKLINKFGNDVQSPDALEKKLKSTKDKDEQMKIFIEEAKLSNK